MTEAFSLILRLSDERQQLYWLAAKQHLTLDQHARLDELNAKLPDLWDTYRRELASATTPQPQRSTSFAERKAA
jgi:hypothetical protein